jgi:glutaminase
MAYGEKSILKQAITGNLAVPEFHKFCEGLVKIFEEIREDRRGHNATYIPELACVDPEKFGLAVCTGM